MSAFNLLNQDLAPHSDNKNCKLPPANQFDGRVINGERLAFEYLKTLCLCLISYDAFFFTVVLSFVFNHKYD